MKKIFIIVTLISALSFSESLTKNVEINSNTSVMNEDTENDNEKSNLEKDGIKKRKEILDQLNSPDNENVGNVGNLGKSFDFNKMFDDIDNYWEILNDGTDHAFNAVSTIGDGLTALTAVGGAFFGLGGVAVAGSHIQAVLQKILMVKNRVDQLKQYKRYIDSVKSLGKNEAKDLAGIVNTLNALSGIIRDDFEFTDRSRGFSDIIQSSDLSTREGWEKLLVENKNIQDENIKAYNKIAGEDYKKAMSIIQKTKQKLQKLDPKNEVQNLQQLNGQMNILIQVMEQLLDNQSANAAIMIQAENKKLEEEIAVKRIKAEEAERLQKAIEESDRKVKNIKLGTRFVGSVNGNR
ncbi:hypothetical protein [Streptobacillus moniliformis]|uniref:Uncharacterized protein n=1 Tax=Streptobacillus moniliformis (strain ATCC 14647 / DSM 12112 / NCTC 10651 / 9901) TaxID=519441 RepID=D1AYH4_STRM9|nr:hypothetical protein [Streptobacillus moniliformis]ACZ01350.1 hypothetical protein Smon_0883 [Streptobacillus moniliformis DSM 12112]AVL43632.1 hypothetical protein CEP89_07430 [Streptobacillus moniliformis]SQA13491.1 Uncharacterised protein [Streptobacillus moniliformis]